MDVEMVSMHVCVGERKGIQVTHVCIPPSSTPLLLDGTVAPISPQFSLCVALFDLTAITKRRAPEENSDSVMDSRDTEGEQVAHTLTLNKQRSLVVWLHTYWILISKRLCCCVSALGCSLPSDFAFAAFSSFFFTRSAGALLNSASISFATQ
jgi:hypothetical protein